MMSRAEEIINLYHRQLSRAATFRTLFQQTANLIFPRENAIVNSQYPGTAKTDDLYDTTAVMASLEMASGLSINLVPPGQRFFVLVASDRDVNENESVKRALAIITERTHEMLFASNFLLQLNETLRSLCVFGTGNLYSEWTAAHGLNFRDYDIGNYLIMENNKGRVDTMIMKFIYTARQAYQQWGDKCGKSVSEAYKDEKKQNDKFEFIHLVSPRQNRNPLLSDNLNMPWESIYVSVKDKAVVDEGGFQEFPYHVARWFKSSNEVFGRGQGTFILPRVKSLQQMYKDYIECGNKWNNPPKEVLDTFEGTVSVTPNAINWVQEIPSIRAIDEGVRGNFPITKDILEFEQEKVRNAFYNDVFVQLAQLKGDRRTQLEIYERIREGLQRLGPPIGRINEELFNPLITRVVLLLLRNGQLPRLPAELAGQPFRIEYVGPLVLALKGQQAKGFQQWAAFVGDMERTFPPESVERPADNIDIDAAIRRMGETFGVNTEDIATKEEVDAKRQARTARLQQQQQLQLAALAAEGYKKTSGKAEQGSPAAELQEAMT